MAYSSIPAAALLKMLEGGPSGVDTPNAPPPPTNMRLPEMSLAMAPKAPAPPPPPSDDASASGDDSEDVAPPVSLDEAPAPDAAPAPAPAPTSAPASAPASASPHIMDLYARLQSAREAGDKQRLIGNIGKSASIINAAFTGAKPDTATDQGLIEQASIPEAQAKTDAALMKLEAASKAKGEGDDPTSVASRAAQDAFMQAGSVIAGKLGADVIRRMSKAQIEKLWAQDTAVRGQDIGKEKADATLALAGSKAEESRRHNKVTEAKDERMLGLRQKAMELTNERYAGTEIGKYVKGTEDLSRIANQMKAIDEIAPGFVSGNGDVGPDTFDRAVRLIPANFGSNLEEPQKVALQSAVQTLQTYIRHPIAGSNLTTNEQKEWERIFQSGVLTDPRAQAAVLKMFKGTVYKQLAHSYTQLKANPAIQQDDLARVALAGAVTPDDPFFADMASRPTGPAPAIPTSVPVREPGGAVAPVPAGPPAPGAAPAVGGPVKKQYSPSRNQTRIIYPDGRVEIVDGKQ